MKIVGVTGWSGSGKTTLIAAVIPLVRARGLTVSTLKHAHHAFDVDVPGKDSHTHREAGATEVLIASGRRFALMRELRGEPEWTLPMLLRQLNPVDLVLVEGFKREPHPKLEVHRPKLGKPLLHPLDAAIRAVATPDPAALEIEITAVALDDTPAVVDILLAIAQPLDEVLARFKTHAPA